MSCVGRKSLEIDGSNRVGGAVVNCSLQRKLTFVAVFVFMISNGLVGADLDPRSTFCLYSVQYTLERVDSTLDYRKDLVACCQV